VRTHRDHERVVHEALAIPGDSAPVVTVHDVEHAVDEVRAGGGDDRPQIVLRRAAVSERRADRRRPDGEAPVRCEDGGRHPRSGERAQGEEGLEPGDARARDDHLRRNARAHAGALVPSRVNIGPR
jgi:hypothetical protein